MALSHEATDGYFEKFCGGITSLIFMNNYRQLFLEQELSN